MGKVSNMPYTSVADQFQDQFQLLLATESELKTEVYRVRYQVYCQELQYEPAENFPNQQEQDEYDDRSVHCLLRHRQSGRYAGCVRLILAQPPDQMDFPFERVCHTLYPSEIDLGEEARPFLGEISRLAVTEQFRKRPGEQTSAVGVSDHSESEPSGRRQFPLIAVSLYLAVSAIVIEGKLEKACTMMEPRLARHLRFFGINCRPVGEVVNYHGRRGPFTITPQEFLNGLDPRFRSLFEYIQSEIRGPLTGYLPKVLSERAEISEMST